MKRIITLLLVALGLSAAAQKYATVNTDYIFASMPDYAQAEAQVSRQAAEWQSELEGKLAEIDRLYKTYQQEAYLLPDNLKRKREEEIQGKEREVKELQRQRFGAGGDLDRKRAELLRPIQERVYSAIERIANQKGYAFVLDRAGNNTVLFASSKYDLSDQVLELLGITPAPAADAPAESGGAPRKSPSNPEMKPPKAPSPKGMGVDRLK